MTRVLDTKEEHKNTNEYITFVSSIKDCATIKNLSEGKRLHVETLRRGLVEKSSHIASALINMYVKCGELAIAKQVLDNLSVKDVVSWSALIAGYAKQRQGSKALDCLSRMRNEGLFPNAVTFASILSACGSTQYLNKGKCIHEEIMSRGLLDKDIVLGSALVDMYTKCGVLTTAQRVLKDLQVQNVLSWSTLIAGYAQQGQGHAALDCFGQMQSMGHFPDAVTFTAALKACSCIGAVKKGKEFHREIIDRDLLKKDVLIGTALVNMYAKFGMLEQAWQSLEELPIRDVVSWNALIAGYSQHDQSRKALDCFECMQSEGLVPDEVTFINTLKACSDIEDIVQGVQIHGKLVDRALLGKNFVIGSALLHMYIKCGMPVKAHQVLQDLHVRDVVCWNALIVGYVQQGQYGEALKCFRQMRDEGLSPDDFTFTCILKACSSTKNLAMGKEVHNKIMDAATCNNFVLGTALMDMYCKCGVLTKAQEVLEGLSVRDVISWSALIAGYVQHRQFHEALDCFERMQSEGVTPGASTLVCILRACGSIGAIDKGAQIHDGIVNRSMLEREIMVGNALVDMYAKCGELAKAKSTLEQLPVRDTVAWSALISGYARWGLGREAIGFVDQMQNEGLVPNDVTFISLLSACCHSGLVVEAQMVFSDMFKKYNIHPNLEHHTCMIVVFASTGHIDKALSVVKVMPSSDYPAAWRAILGKCKKWGNMKVGRWIFDEVALLQRTFRSADHVMDNTFALPARE